MDEKITIKIGSFTKKEKKCDENEIEDQIAIRTNVISLFRIISLKKDKCTECSSESYRIFGGLCNNCIDENYYKSLVLDIDEIMMNNFYDRRYFLFVFDCEYMKNEKCVNSDINDPIIAIKKSILYSIRRNIV